MSNVIDFRGKHHTNRTAQSIINREIEENLADAQAAYAKEQAAELLKGQDLMSQTLFGPILEHNFLTRGIRGDD